jgi:3'(2'), 5'-bisphosphate nucleotidase
MHHPDLDAALEAVAEAGRYLLGEYDRFVVIPNAPANITTAADKESQEIILKVLHRRFPADAFSAEENTPTLAQAPPKAERLWIIDPIDGTRGFARKNGEFSIMVGLVERGVIQVGVVSQPAARRLTYATRGGGCWRLDGDAAPVRCRVTPTAELSQATLTQSHSKQPGVKSKWIEALEPANIVETYSAGIKLALVARGDADLYLNTYEAFKDWDICAGHLLVSEAGGQVTGIAGQELKYGLPGAWQKDGLLATNGNLHQAAVAKLKSLT